jgi:hypothetical protein
MITNSELKAWLIEKLSSLNSPIEGIYSVAVCRSCSKRYLWGGEIKGAIISECRICCSSEMMDFHSFDLNVDVDARIPAPQMPESITD